ncbi:MAG: MMPL family transporter [Propionibacteriales bacterium]|nr:MMPL family transporter [Propionibacteriales bacterium]
MSHSLLNRPSPPTAARGRPGPLGRIARVSFRRRGLTVLGWLAALAVAVGLTSAFGADFEADYSVQGSESKRAQDLLGDRFPTQSGDTVDVVVRADGGVSAAKADVQSLLDELAAVPHVASVDDPYATPGGVSPDGNTLVAHLRLDVVNPVDMPIEDSERLLDIADDAENDQLEIALGGQSIAFAEQGEIGSEMIGVIAAALILLITFGSVVAAGLPILVALFGLAVSATLTGLIAAFVGVPDWATSVATMMGLGIGIDYVLLMVTRFREWRAAGLDTETATVATVDTAGRSVIVAGATVVVSMLGLFAMGLSYMRGVSVVTIVAVLVVMAASITLFPALLGYLGRHIDRLRIPLGRRRQVEVEPSGHVVPGRGWVRWSRLIDGHSVIATVVGLGLVAALAAPVLGLRFGFADAGNAQETTSSRQAYDLLAESFGDGANGPLLIAVDLTDGSQAALNRLGTELADTEGVAGVTPPQVNETGDAAVLTVFPETGPQDAATEDLVHSLRDDVVPAATAGTGIDAMVGGATAMSIDSTEDVAKRLPLLIAGVVLLSMLLLLVAFRSVVIPVTAAMMNLLSVGAAYGVVALVSEGGWAGQLIGIDTETPLPAFVPVLMFAILFGLSMDYEVFLVSRMRESWLRHKDNSRAIVSGLAGTGRVITAAAAIMIAVFAAFVPSPDVMLKVIGVGMAAAILIDATIIRMLLVPAVMHLFGRANWWLPDALDRRLPQLHIEGHPEMYLDRGPTPEESESRGELAPARV